MSTRGVRTLVALAFASTPLAARAVETRAFIQADVANLRVEPDRSAAVAARLRINTEVAVLGESGDFVQVRFSGTRTAGGFVERSLLGAAPVDLAAARTRAAEAAAAGDKASAILWAERAVAIDGSDAAALEALARAYRDGGNRAKAQSLERVRNGRTDVLLAMCIEGKVMLLAEISPKGSHAELTSPAAEKRRKALAPDIPIARWFELDPDRSAGPVAGTPFAFPEEQPNGAAGDIEQAPLALARCDAPGALYATTPLAAVTVARQSRELLRLLDGPAIDVVETSTQGVYQEYDGPKVRVTVRKVEVFAGSARTLALAVGRVALDEKTEADLIAFARLPQLGVRIVAVHSTTAGGTYGGSGVVLLISAGDGQLVRLGVGLSSGGC